MMIDNEDEDDYDNEAYQKRFVRFSSLTISTAASTPLTSPLPPPPPPPHHHHDPSRHSLPSHPIITITSPSLIIHAGQASCERLGGLPIDLYQLHFPSEHGNEALWDGLGDAYEMGLVG